MHHVLLGKNPMTAVQQEPVQAIFKSIGVDEPGKNSEQEIGARRRHKPYGDEKERQARQRRCDQVIPLDSQSLRLGFGPNDAVSICMHRLIKLARSANARKRACPERDAVEFKS